MMNNEILPTTDEDVLADHLCRLCAEPKKARPMIRHRLRAKKITLKTARNVLLNWWSRLEANTLPEDVRTRSADELIQKLEEREAFRSAAAKRRAISVAAKCDASYWAGKLKKRNWRSLDPRIADRFYPT